MAAAAAGRTRDDRSLLLCVLHIYFLAPGRNEQLAVVNVGRGARACRTRNTHFAGTGRRKKKRSLILDRGELNGGLCSNVPAAGLAMRFIIALETH